MIRTQLNQPQPKRRIAVIEIPRQQARLGHLGVIRNGPVAAAGASLGWTTISDEAPDSSANFMSSVIQQQQSAQLTTPGTLTYTPASATPAQNVSPWNSWLQPNCPPGSANDAATSPSDPSAIAQTAAVPTDEHSTLWLLVGLLGAAASATYLYRSAKGR